MRLVCGCRIDTTEPATMEEPCDQHGLIPLRDHFAGQALLGWFSAFSLMPHPDSFQTFATNFYQMADVMLATREKK